MAQTTVYTCDICKQSKSKENLAKITAKAEGIRMKGYGYNDIKIDVCKECLKRKGFIVEPKENEEEDEQAKMHNKATFEDRIYDFLSDMGVMFVE